MDSFSFNELTEEVFGHLCNVALNKCNDKGERRKAGCGGRAMRKRVLIKNFVSDLFKMHKNAEAEAKEDGEILSQDEYENEAGNDAIYEDDDYNEVDEDVEEEDFKDNGLRSGNQLPSRDCWLSSANESSMMNNECVSHSNSYDQFPDPLNARSHATSRTEHVSFSIMGGGVLSLYDVYSDVSERATEGDLPSPSDPLASMSPLLEDHGSPNEPYNCLFEPRYDVTDISSDILCGFSRPIRAMCESAGGVAPLQPLSAEPQDELFLSLTNNSYSEMKSYTFPMDPNSMLSHCEPIQLTDLDAENQSRRNSSKKRRFNKYYDEPLNIDFQKRIKL